MQTDAIKPGQAVIVVDDLLATGTCTLIVASQNYNQLARRIRESGWRTRIQTGWSYARVSLHHRDPSPQGSRSVRRSGIFY